MGEIEEMCDRVIFLMRGNIADEGTPLALRERFGKNNLEDIFLQIVKEGKNH